jgi:hypothetical protein
VEKEGKDINETDDVSVCLIHRESQIEIGEHFKIIDKRNFFLHVNHIRAHKTLPFVAERLHGSPRGIIQWTFGRGTIFD